MSKSILKPVLASLALLVGAAGLTAPTVASGGGGGGGSSNSARSEIRLEGRMRSGRIEAKVAWRQETRGTSVRRKVQAEIYRATPNTQYVVTHMGKTVGTITTNAAGNGRFEIERTSLKMAQGDAVAVGTMKGTLAPKR